MHTTIIHIITVTNVNPIIHLKNVFHLPKFITLTQLSRHLFAKFKLYKL